MARKKRKKSPISKIEFVCFVAHVGGVSMLQKSPQKSSFSPISFTDQQTLNDRNRQTDINKQKKHTHIYKLRSEHKRHIYRNASSKKKIYTRENICKGMKETMEQRT